MIKLLIAFALVLGAVAVSAATDVTIDGYAVYDGDALSFVQASKLGNGTAWAARITATLNSTTTPGWDRVVVTASRELLQTDAVAAYKAAGWAEGFATWESIITALHNQNLSTGSAPASAAGETNPDKTMAWLEENWNNMKQYAASSTNSAMRHGVARLVAQVQGIAAGVGAAIKASSSPHIPTPSDLLIYLNCAQAEMGDIETAAYGEAGPPTSAPTPSTAAPHGTTASPTTVPASTTAAPAATSTTAAPTTTTNVSQPEQADLLQVEMLRAAEAQGASYSASASSRARRIKTADSFTQHCSALIRITDSDLFHGHDTWSGFSSLGPRQYKTYNFETSVTMSGYPGSISSIDDAYITGHKMTVIETTNVQFNNELVIKYTTTDTVLEFMRVMVANYWAADGATWTELFLVRNSGTYCNQYMVVDMKLVSQDALKNKALPPNTFWLVEQMPGPNSVRQDMTSFLNDKGFWPSYNIPYFASVYELSGAKAQCAQGSIFCYTNYSRAEIFARDAPNVQTLQQFKDLLRYNDAPGDKLSLIPDCKGCVPAYNYQLSIANRADLVPVGQVWGNLTKQPIDNIAFMQHSLFGAIDTKVFSFGKITPLVGANADGVSDMAFTATAEIIAGPTTGSAAHPLPAFSWADWPESKTLHQGQPTVFNHPFVSAAAEMKYAQASPWPISESTASGLTEGQKIGAIVGGVIGGVLLIVCVLAIRNKWKQQRLSTGFVDGVQQQPAGKYEQV